jgi:5'-3' exoribonuclease 1
MNQQRARRFRTALDVEVAREKAIREGKEMPKEEAFDSNAITPGRWIEALPKQG